jgi:hypothetical protein
MTLTNNIATLEKSKFEERGDGAVSVRTVSQTSGLTKSGLVTIVAVNQTTWTKLPATALAGRNAVCIQNRSGQEIKINYSDAVVGYVGVVIPNNGERYYDISDDIAIWCKSTSSSANVTVEEIA